MILMYSPPLSIFYDGSQALNSLNSLSVRDPSPSPTSTLASAAPSGNNTGNNSSRANNSRSITSEATHFPSDAQAPAPRAGTPTAAELAERRRRAMELAGFVHAAEWHGMD